MDNSYDDASRDRRETDVHVRGQLASWYGREIPVLRATPYTGENARRLGPHTMAYLPVANYTNWFAGMRSTCLGIGVSPV
jgi:hypothetical protein